MKYLLLLPLIASLFLTGCQTYQPPVVTDRTISNPTVGFNGYEVTIPAGLIPAEKLAIPVYGEFIAEVSEGYIIRGGDQYDTVLLNGYQKSVAFIVSEFLTGSHTTFVDQQTGAYTTAQNRFGQLGKNDQMRYLGLVIEDLNPRIQENVTREVVTINGRPTGLVTEVVPKAQSTIYTYITLGKMSEAFILIGASPDQYAPDLKMMMEKMIASLTVY